MLECVPNVSEGRDEERIRRFATECGAALLDVHVDRDHHRSVFTLAGSGGAVEGSARRLAHAVASELDVTEHAGAHPRFGALDVVPFVALDGVRGDAIRAAHEFATWAASTLAVGVFFYDQADDRGRSLPVTRREAFVVREPDLGPRDPHPRLGAIAVGARPVLVAVNCDLDCDDLEAARAIARGIRERNGGLPGVRAIGLRLDSRGIAQVSMNLVALDRTGIEAACSAVRSDARARNVDVDRVELVGLLPASELARCSREFLDWTGLGPEVTIEARLAATAG
jgi:glutamate formiminotransferase / 5-formyltetrahydrofolate cyclo-ligase